MNDILLSAQDISKTFTLKDGTKVHALDTVSFSVKRGGITALVGPDGAGKSTLLRLVARLLYADSGDFIFDGKAYSQQKKSAQFSIAYMPQKFGLYEDLTVQENLDLFADLYNVPLHAREERYNTLLDMCAMQAFRARLAGKLSGGMKQKLGLICTLVSPPQLLLLDEPTVGVDPLSRKELWFIIDKLTKASQMSVIVSTSYLDEASMCDELVLLFEGKMLANGSPKEITEYSKDMSYLFMPKEDELSRVVQARIRENKSIVDAVPQGDFVRLVYDKSKDSHAKMAQFLEKSHAQKVESSLEDSFILLLGSHVEKENQASSVSIIEDVEIIDDFSHVRDKNAEIIIETQHVSRFFGDFKAVNDVSFSVRKGEVFGLLGPNGAGKTTTFRMLCGLLPASKGNLFVAGVDVRKARKEARRHLGYVAQKFSLYGPLNPKENLNFFAGAYGLRGRHRQERIDAVIADFALEPYLSIPSSSLPGGYKQRLAMAVGLLHEPEILFLDEATSGADPLARRDFWKRISALSEQGVTIVVTTHFMEEAEYCDSILIQDSGIMLAFGSPKEIRAQVIRDESVGVDFKVPSMPTMEESFIHIVTQSRELKKGRGFKRT